MERVRKVGANRDHRANTYLAFQLANKLFILDDLQGRGSEIAWARGILVGSAVSRHDDEGTSCSRKQTE